MSECDMAGCSYNAEFELPSGSYCKWCAHALKPDLVEQEHPALEVLP